MPPNFFVLYNKDDKTPEEMFTYSHTRILKEASEWLNNTSQSCSVVAGLIATVAFATATAVPGGVKEDTGRPTLENEPAFVAFAIASLVALCLSITSLVIFVSIPLSRYHENLFRVSLPRKLMLGLTSLSLSMVSMLIAFCTGHLLMLKDKLQQSAYLVYTIAFLPLALFVIGHIPLFCNLIFATFTDFRSNAESQST